MRIDRLLARRNAKTVRLNTGSGGIPDIPATELASMALAECPHKLGAGILECWHCPVASDPQRVSKVIQHTLLDECTRRAADVMHAEMAWHLARIGVSVLYTECAAMDRFEQAKSERWPNYHADRYQRLAHAVVAELIGAARCPICAGRGFVAVADRRSICTNCHGDGHAPLSRHARAGAVGIDHKSFARWEPVYAWLLVRLRTELRQAADWIDGYCRAPA